MLAEFYRRDAPAEVVARARWTGSGVQVDIADEAIREALGRVYRATAVSVDDPSLRTAGTTGPVVLPPGSLPWFVHASRVRAGSEGLEARLVAERPTGGGWDPAAAYRTFAQSVERRARMDGAGDR